MMARCLGRLDARKYDGCGIAASKRRGKMYRGKITFLTLVKLGALVGLVAALVALGGCSCKKQEEQIALEARFGVGLQNLFGAARGGFPKPAGLELPPCDA